MFKDNQGNIADDINQIILKKYESFLEIKIIFSSRNKEMLLGSIIGGFIAIL